MDEEDEVIFAEIEVEDIDATGPVCTYGSWDKEHIKTGQTAQITVTCTGGSSIVIIKNNS